jgi:type II secretory pathway pseudopilin PulG
MSSHVGPTRRGISLLEVLISIGILAVGLSSVVALVPAGKSEAAKAVILDRSANLAMNVLNDAVTFGLTRPNSIEMSSTANQVVFDPLYFRSNTFVWVSGSTNVVSSGTLKPSGVFARTTSSSTMSANAATAMIESWSVGRDDVVYGEAAKDDEPPTNLFAGSERAFQGRTTALVSIRPVSGTFSSGSFARVSAVIFHGRNGTDPSDAIVTGTYNDPLRPVGTILVGTLPEGRTLKEAIHPGVVVYSANSDNRWYQVAMASIDEGTPGLVYVTFTGDVEPVSGPVRIALDSVGLAERIVVLESPGAYGR